ncbi:MAG TPA: hypothetical protein VNA24_35705 [Hyalangium sp.]|nr:hypothetical protein [Hyalangium sp.]
MKSLPLFEFAMSLAGKLGSKSRTCRERSMGSLPPGLGWDGNPVRVSLGFTPVHAGLLGE